MSYQWASELTVWCRRILGRSVVESGLRRHVLTIADGVLVHISVGS